MNRENIGRMIAPVVEIYSSGELRGAAYFDDPSTASDVTVGSIDLSESEVALAVYKIVKARGFNVALICTAVIMLDRSEQARN